MAAGRIVVPSWMPALDSDGNPIPNVLLYVYQNLTTTLASVFSDEALTIPLTNPVPANSSGRLPAIWADDAVDYSVSVEAPYGPAGIPFTFDDLSPSQSADFLAAAVAEAAATDAAISAGEAEEALAEILEFAATAPDAPSIINKANRNGDNITDAVAFGQSLGLRRTSATLNVASPAAGLDAVSPQLMTRGQTITAQLPASAISVTSPVLWQHPMSSSVKLRGVAPTATTITNISSVTGSAGAWVVTATVADASGIAIGDGLAIRNVTPGWVTPGSYAARKLVAGEMRMQFFSSGSLSTSGTTATATSGTNATYLDNNNIVGIGGEVRQISAVAASTFTLGPALAANAPATQYWYGVKEGAGTVTASGTALTGVGTAFLTTANIGDEIWIAGFGVRRIAGITTDTAATLDRGATVAVGAAYGLMTCGWRHEGAFLVTAVSGNQVTWTNYNRSPQSRPPVNLISGGDVAIFKTVLSCTSSAFQIEGGQTLDIDNVFLYGPTGTTTVAFDCRGSDGKSNGQLTLGSNVAVARFGYAIFTGVGTRVYGVNLDFAGQTNRGVNAATSAEININAVRGSGVNGIGVFIGDSSGVRGNAAIITGCADDGCRAEVRGGGWWDFSVASHNDAKGYHYVGGTSLHLVGSWSIANTEEGYIGENGGDGRLTGFLALSNSTGVTASGHIELQQAFLSGNGNNLIATATGRANANNVGASAAVADNFQAIGGGAFISLTNARSVNAADDGIAVSLGGSIYASAIAFAGNGTDAEAVTQGQIYLSGATGLTTTSPTLRNQYATDGALIADGTSPIGQNYTAVTQVQAGLVAVPTATKTLLVSVAVPGVTLNNCRGILFSDNLATIENVSFSAEVTANDVIGIYGVQWSGSSVNVGGRTWYTRTFTG